MTDLREAFRGTTLLITGGTGLIGSRLVDFLESSGAHLILLGRNAELAKKRFGPALDNGRIEFLHWDATSDELPEIPGNVDYVLHLASTTHPVAYATDPVSTIVLNVEATRRLLDLCARKKVKRFAFVSSVEIYGWSEGAHSPFKEDHAGRLDCNCLRAGYPESKRCGESLCQAYAAKYGLDIVIPRLCRIYGPTLLRSDSKAMSQFLWNALAGEDIVLKSAGNQKYSYLYVDDAVSGILTVLLHGARGEAYNVADARSDVTLLELTRMIAGIVGRRVIVSVPSETESVGFSKASYACLDSAKLQGLGWKAEYGLEAGLNATLQGMKLAQACDS